MGFRTPPPSFTTPVLVSFPTPQILLATLNNPQQMNCVTQQGHVELSQLFAWYDAEPTLRCAIITGTRASVHNIKRKDAFSAGADLKEWLSSAGTGAPPRPPIAFAGLSTRTGRKPVIAAVHGLALGGGMEAVAACDLIVAHASSTFGLPEAARGVVPIAGVLPRLARTVGMQRATELALTGRVLSAAEARDWGFVNHVVDGDGADAVVRAALDMAGRVCAMSPDSVLVTREGLRSAWTAEGVDEATARILEGKWRALEKGENVLEGLRAFQEKREPHWVDSKL